MLGCFRMRLSLEYLQPQHSHPQGRLNTIGRFLANMWWGQSRRYDEDQVWEAWCIESTSPRRPRIHSGQWQNSLFCQANLCASSSSTRSFGRGSIPWQTIQSKSGVVLEHALTLNWKSLIPNNPPIDCSVSRTGFLTWLKEQEGQDWQKDKTSRMIVKEKLSERAVVKERRLGRVFPQERGKEHQIGTSKSDH